MHDFILLTLRRHLWAGDLSLKGLFSHLIKE